MKRQEEEEQQRSQHQVMPVTLRAQDLVNIMQKYDNGQTIMIS